MSNVGSVTAPMFISATINIMNEVREGRPEKALQVAFGNVALFAGLVAVGQFVDWGLAGILAVLNLLYTFLHDGADFINWLSKLVNGIGE